MPRPSKITYEEVATACNDLARDGIKPTYAALLGRVGGSYPVLKLHLSRWLEEASAAQKYALPDELAKELGLWYQRAASQAKADAELWRQEQSVLMAAERQALQGKLDAAMQATMIANDARLTLSHELSLKNVQFNYKDEEATALRSQVARFESQIAAEKIRGDTAEANLLARIAEQDKERITHGAELMMAEERTRGTEKALLLRHGTEVEHLKQRAQRAEAELEGAKVARDAHIAIANKLRDEVSRLLGRIEAMGDGLKKENK